MPGLQEYVIGQEVRSRGELGGLARHLFPFLPLPPFLQVWGTSHTRVRWPGSGIEGVCFLQLLSLKIISMPNCHTLG